MWLLNLDAGKLHPGPEYQVGRAALFHVVGIGTLTRFSGLTCLEVDGRSTSQSCEHVECTMPTTELHERQDLSTREGHLSSRHPPDACRNSRELLAAHSQQTGCTAARSCLENINDVTCINSHVSGSSTTDTGSVSAGKRECRTPVTELNMLDSRLRRRRQHEAGVDREVEGITRHGVEGWLSLFHEPSELRCQIHHTLHQGFFPVGDSVTRSSSSTSNGMGSAPGKSWSWRKVVTSTPT